MEKEGNVTNVKEVVNDERDDKNMDMERKQSLNKTTANYLQTMEITDV